MNCLKELFKTCNWRIKTGEPIKSFFNEESIKNCYKLINEWLILLV